MQEHGPCATSNKPVSWTTFGLPTNAPSPRTTRESLLSRGLDGDSRGYIHTQTQQRRFERVIALSLSARHGLPTIRRRYHISLASLS
jgi:hypothetical protein